MRRLIGSFLGVALLVVGGMRVTAAEPADDVALLSQKGLGEEVLLAFVDRVEGTFALTPDQIIKLKQAGVPEKVIAAMLRKRAAVPSAQTSVSELQTAYKYTAPRTQVIRAAEPVTVYDSTPTVVYRSNPVYTSAYYPSSYYPSSYYWGYSSPFIFSSWGCSSSRWGWGGGFRSYGSFGFGSHHGGGSHRGGGSGHRR